MGDFAGQAGTLREVQACRLTFSYVSQAADVKLKDRAKSGMELQMRHVAHAFSKVCVPLQPWIDVLRHDLYSGTRAHVYSLAHMHVHIHTRDSITHAHVCAYKHSYICANVQRHSQVLRNQLMRLSTRSPIL